MGEIGDAINHVLFLQAKQWNTFEQYMALVRKQVGRTLTEKEIIVARGFFDLFHRVTEVMTCQPLL